MQIVFYNNTAEMERVDKTNYLNKNFEIFGYLKNSTSIVNPTIVVELKRDVVEKLIADDNNSLIKDDENKNIVLLDKLLKSNYCYISDFNRYYYIDDIVSIANNLWEISLDCDVLYTYKDKIIENEAFIDRQENLYNDEIIDEIRVYEQGYELGVQDINVELFNKDTTNEYTSVICCSALEIDLVE